MTIVFVLMLVSLLMVFALDIRQKVRRQMLKIDKRSDLPGR